MKSDKIGIHGKQTFQVYHTNSISSDSSTSSSSSGITDTRLRRFNRLLRTAVARHWAQFRKIRPVPTRGRSISDAGLCSIVDNDSVSEYLDIAESKPRRSFQIVRTQTVRVTNLPPLLPLSSSSSAVALEEASDGSDTERHRRKNHLRVPTPACLIPHDNPMEAWDSMWKDARARIQSVRRESLPLATIRKSLLIRSLSPENFRERRRSTGNFATGAAGGGCGAPRSAPATPLQLEPLQNSRPMKHDKQAVKPLSSSVPSVRQTVATGAGAVSDASEGKAPSKARQKKFFRHFPQVGPEERVLNYYSCALVGDILLQGHLYITKNYFAFYSNVFGYVTKLLIPTPSVLRVTKEKMARIIPNAVGVCTRDERHVFGSLLSRDSTYKLMMHVWKQARAVELRAEPPPQIQHVSETELEASEFSVEDETSSAGGEETPQPTKRREPDAIITGPGAAVIQPGLLTGAARAHSEPRTSLGRMFLLTAAILLMLSAACLAHQLYRENPVQHDLSKLSGSELYSELVRWRARLHGRAATELQAFLSTNLMLLTKVRQSLETLSGVILTDMAQAQATGANTVHAEVPPNETAFS